ncbi:MAG: hypothetical protein AAB870_00065 [Patescibacteria group bacterium]
MPPSEAVKTEEPRVNHNGLSRLRRYLTMNIVIQVTMYDKPVADNPKATRGKVLGLLIAIEEETQLFEKLTKDFCYRAVGMIDHNTTQTPIPFEEKEIAKERTEHYGYMLQSANMQLELLKDVLEDLTGLPRNKYEELFKKIEDSFKQSEDEMTKVIEEREARKRSE